MEEAHSPRPRFFVSPKGGISQGVKSEEGKEAEEGERKRSREYNDNNSPPDCVEKMSIAMSILRRIGLLIGVCAHAAVGDRPSFVFLLSESLDGRLLRPDSLARIPNIRALLAGGSVRFDSAYSNSPVCAPSRSSMHSGRAPHKIPHEHNGMLVRGVCASGARARARVPLRPPRHRPPLSPAGNNYEGLPTNYSARLDQLLNASGYATLVAGKTDWTVGGHSLEDRLEGLTFNVQWPYNITDDGGWSQEPGSDMCASDGPVFKGGSAGARHFLTTGASSTRPPRTLRPRRFPFTRSWARATFCTLRTARPSTGSTSPRMRRRRQSGRRSRSGTHATCRRS